MTNMDSQKFASYMHAVPVHILPMNLVQYSQNYIIKVTKISQESKSKKIPEIINFRNKTCFNIFAKILPNPSDVVS